MIGYSMKRIWKPEIFQGVGKYKDYFEGWYFKIVDEKEENVYGIIPGIAMGKNKSDSHSFIQVINGKSHESKYYKYPADSFSYSKNRFEVVIDENFFSLNRLKLSVGSENEKIKGELVFDNLKPWPSSALSPGTMGWYSFVPFMECYHGCLSMNHNIEGSLTINDNEVSFSGGKGYMEKDWGKSFPSSWIWAQSNHFDREGTSIMVSIANIPWLGGHFTGFIVGLLLEAKFYKFTTYTGAKINYIKFQNNSISINISDRKYELDIIITKSDGGRLYSPINGAMIGEINESLSAIIDFCIYRLSGKSRIKIAEHHGKNTGLEAMGDLTELIKA